MSGLAHYLEREGLTTANLALVKQHAIAQTAPRALWVPFWFGRPFGVPNQPVFQRRVLDAALDLLDEREGPILRDFDVDPPVTTATEDWRPPFKLLAPPDAPISPEALSQGFLREVAEMSEKHAAVFSAKGHTLAGVSGLSIEGIASLIVEFLHGREAETTLTDRPGLALKFGCQELTDVYSECVVVNGTDAPFAIRRWFWKHTYAGLAIRMVQDIAKTSQDVRARTLAEAGAFVPREWHQ